MSKNNYIFYKLLKIYTFFNYNNPRKYFKDYSTMLKKISIKDYAKLKNQSLSNIYQKINRGTLQSQKIDGKTYILEEVIEQPKTKKHNCKKSVKHLKKHIKNLEALLNSKQGEIETLKISFDLLSRGLNAQLKTLEKPIIDTVVKTSKKDKRKNLHKKKK